VKAIRLNPRLPSSYGNLGWAYYKMDDDRKSIEYSGEAVSLDTTVYYARYNLALAHLRAGDLEYARELYQEMGDIERFVPKAQVQGAINDLKDLLSKGFHISEVRTILKEIFHLKEPIE